MLATLAIPPELLQQDVFWGVNEQAAPIELNPYPPAELLRIERSVTGHEEVDLDGSVLMDQVRGAPRANRAFESCLVQAKLDAQQVDETGNVVLFEGRHEVSLFEKSVREREWGREAFPTSKQ